MPNFSKMEKRVTCLAVIGPLISVSVIERWFRKTSELDYSTAVDDYGLWLFCNYGVQRWKAVLLWIWCSISKSHMFLTPRRSYWAQNLIRTPALQNRLTLGRSWLHDASRDSAAFPSPSPPVSAGAVRVTPEVTSRDAASWDNRFIPSWHVVPVSQ